MERTINRGAIITLLTGIILSVFFIAVTVSTYAAVDEQECNDTWQEANTISMGTTVYGTKDLLEEDWYVFKAPINGTAKVTLYNDKYSERLVNFVVHSNPDGQCIKSLFINPGSNDYCKFGVSAGKEYYLHTSSSVGVSDYHFKVTYVIGKTSITNTYRKDNAFKVKWTKKSKASFYQVRYIKKSVYEDYGWSKAKKIKVGKKYSAVTKKKLANKKTYYVQVRVARTINGHTYYSPWSAKKAVKTK